MGGSPSVPEPEPPPKPPEPAQPFSSFDVDAEKRRRAGMSNRQSLVIPKEGMNVGSNTPGAGG
jgi:hypothetical protein